MTFQADKIFMGVLALILLVLFIYITGFTEEISTYTVIVISLSVCLLCVNSCSILGICFPDMTLVKYDNKKYYSTKCVYKKEIFLIAITIALMCTVFCKIFSIIKVNFLI